MEETKRAYERLLNALEDLELLKKLPSYEEKGTDPLFEKVKEPEEDLTDKLEKARKVIRKVKVSVNR